MNLTQLGITRGSTFLSLAVEDSGLVNGIVPLGLFFA